MSTRPRERKWTTRPDGSCHLERENMRGRIRPMNDGRFSASWETIVTDGVPFLHGHRHGLVSARVAKTYVYKEMLWAYREIKKPGWDELRRVYLASEEAEEWRMEHKAHRIAKAIEAASS